MRLLLPTRRQMLTALALLPLAGMTGRPSRSAPRRLRKWECINEECEPYVYDPSVGDLNVVDLDHPIPPGVAFEDLPDDWICPICGDPKRDFIPLDDWVEV